ncbi:MAG: S-layer homology domain-containing protein, partial [Oscillospiraceae bacterium]|nr:S-layer homology domain-containing protein [Oscillospiraceae bacterium]
QEREPLYADMEGEDQRGELYTAAAYLYDAGVIKGVPTEEGTILFQPGRQITRAEFFTMLARWMGLDLEQYQDVALPFNDAAQVPDWALGEVKAMYSLGILKGAGGDDGLWVNAQATISRAEVMTLLGRTQPKGYGEAPMDFEDGGQVPDWALPYAASLVSQGVVEGQDNKILPLSPATRGEVAKMLYFML